MRNSGGYAYEPPFGDDNYLSDCDDAIDEEAQEYLYKPKPSESFFNVKEEAETKELEEDLEAQELQFQKQLQELRDKEFHPLWSSYPNMNVQETSENFIVSIEIQRSLWDESPQNRIIISFLFIFTCPRDYPLCAYKPKLQIKTTQGGSEQIPAEDRIDTEEYDLKRLISRQNKTKPSGDYTGRIAEIIRISEGWISNWTNRAVSFLKQQFEARVRKELEEQKRRAEEEERRKMIERLRENWAKETNQDAKHVSLNDQEISEMIKQEQEENWEMDYLKSRRIRKRPNGMHRLKELCIESIGDNLFYYESLEGVPLPIRAQIFAYVTYFYQLHPRHLELLVEPQLRTLDFVQSKQTPYLEDAHLSPIASTCAQLTKLALSGATQISDTVMAEIARGCHRIEELYINDCIRLTDTALEKLAEGCPAVRILNMSHLPKVTGSGLYCIARRCDQLSWISIEGCKSLTHSAVLEPIFLCRNLHYLDARKVGTECPSQGSGNYFVLAEPIYSPQRKREIRSMSSLETLLLDGSPFASDGFLSYFFLTKAESEEQRRQIPIVFSNLRRISLNNCPVYQSCLRRIHDCVPGLQELNLLGWEFSGTNLPLLCTFAHCLQVVHLGREATKKTGEANAVAVESVLALLNKCKFMRELKLINHPHISGADILDAVKMHKTLRVLDLTGVTSPESHSSQLPSSGAMPNRLQSLSVANCPEWVDDALVINTIAKYYPYLTHLDLSGNPNVTERSLSALLDSCTLLTSLDIGSTSFGSRVSNCDPNLCFEVAKKLPPNLKHLRLAHLDFSQTGNPYQLYRNIFQRCPYLQELSMWDVTPMGASVWEDVGKHLKRLKVLKMAGGQTVTVPYVEKLAGRGKLQKLQVHSLPQETIEYLNSRFRGLEIVHATSRYNYYDYEDLFALFFGD